MPKYITIHQAPGVSQEEFQANTGPVLEGKYATNLQTFANLMEGFIVTYYEAASEADLVKEFERLGFPYQEIHEIQFAATSDDLRKMAGGH
jgi:hypothetical protein